ncbi:aspartate aminotransferase family protein [Sporosarcina sp. 179-K 3D1 HS]|uniref:aspartate aminotransferase family protein n=1 Tax=Sporosarcina sp. 179-K 3D1 HS TaxID=3232169 RepID=UPI0039A29CD7
MQMKNISGMDAFKKKTQTSYTFSQRAKQVMPGGVTANIKFFEPYPIVMKSGSGAYLTDVDGNEYIDYLLSYGASMTGHGHPKITEAIEAQLSQDGTYLFGTPHEWEVVMGEKIQKLYPSMEKVRYTNSGTEATLLATRIAHAYTGKAKIAKFEGHYHGGYDQMLLSVNPPLDLAGPQSNPTAVPESKGMHPYHAEHTVILPFNQWDETKEILNNRQGEIAAVIMEPIQSGFIPAKRPFVENLRKLSAELGILLIFDEVKTGFRLGLGGAQEVYGVRPDLTTLGKVVGGGFPIGMVGGKKGIMEISAPSAASDVFDSSQSKKSRAQDVLFHSGTYNGHPTILAAGLATIELLEQEMASVLQNTERLKKGITDLFAAKGVPALMVGEGSIFNPVITEQSDIRDYRDLQAANFKVRKEVDYHLLAHGIYTKPLNRYSMATVHGKKEIDRTLEAYETVLTTLFG